MQAEQELMDGSESNVRADVGITLAILDCYAHTQVCSYCTSVDPINRRLGYDLIQERDTAVDDALRAVGFESSGNRLENSISQEQQAPINEDPARNGLMSHRNSRNISDPKIPAGRTPVWTMEAARSRRTV
jgi:hypothetical protein